MAKQKESTKKVGKARELKSGDKNKAASKKTKKASAGGKKQTKKAALKNADKEQSFLQKTKQFFREVKVELKKVSWPSRKETLASTSVVLVLVFLVSVYLGLVDILLSRALKVILH